MKGTGKGNGKACVFALVCVALMIAASMCILGNVVTRDDFGSDDDFIGEKESHGEYQYADGDFKSGGLTYRIEDSGHVLVTDFKRNYKDIVVPDTVTDGDGKTYTVDKIGERGLSTEWAVGRHPNSVEIGPKIKVIDTRGISNDPAWYGGTTKFTIRDVENSELTEIGLEAFYRCKIKSVDLPASLKTIGESAFRQCELEEVNLRSSDISIGDYAFFECMTLKSISLKAVSHIGASAFVYTKIGKASLDSIQSIGVEAFKYCGELNEISFGPSLAEVGEGAFYNIEKDTCFVDANGKDINYTDAGALRGHTFVKSDDKKMHEIS